MQPLITVIIPVYKVELYLERCIESVRNQIYTNLEIILVDDGSPDNCPQICDDYAKRDNRIIVIHKENGGLSSARNSGLDIMTGQYVTFLDSDDFFHNEFVFHLYNLAEKYDADLVKCGYIKGSGTKFNKQNTKEVIEIYDRRSVFLKYKNKIAAWGLLYKTILWANVRFPVGMLNEDDITTW